MFPNRDPNSATEKHTHTQPFYGPFSGTTRVSRCQKRTKTLWCKGSLTEADTLTIRLDTTPSGLTSAHLHHPPPFFTGWMPFLPPNQQCQSTEGNHRIWTREKTLEFSSTVLHAPPCSFVPLAPDPGDATVCNAVPRMLC